MPEGEILERTMAERKRAAEGPDWRTGIDLSREDELLIHCARLDLFQERRIVVKNLLAEGLDWDSLLDKAAWHRLLPLVSYHLGSPDLSVFVSRPMLEKLQRLKYQSLARNMLLQNGLSQILSAFNEVGIPVIVLKGAALLGSIYRDIGLRPMSDLDILVRPEHLDRTEAIALCYGYAPIVERVVQEHDTIDRRHLPNLIHHERGIVLEIHQHIVDSDGPYHFNLNGFWSGARPVSLLGVPALVLATEDQLIHLCINFLLDRHYSSHFALGQLCDISELISGEGDSLNWDLVERVADDVCIQQGIHYVLYACEQLLGSKVPASVLSRLQPLEFNSSLAKLFLRRRVLDTRPWLAHQLVASGSAYTLPRAIRAALVRLFPTPRRFSKKYELREYSNSLYLKRVTEKLWRLGCAMLRPLEMKEDLLLDRWLHDLCGSTTQNPAS